MTEGLKWTVNEVPKSDDKHLELMSEENVKKAKETQEANAPYDSNNNKPAIEQAAKNYYNILK